MGQFISVCVSIRVKILRRPRLTLRAILFLRSEIKCIMSLTVMEIRTFGKQAVTRTVLGDRLYSGSLYAIGPLSYSCLSVTLVYCNQTVGWIKMKLGMEVGLGPGHIVLDGDLASLHIWGTSPNFSQCLLWPNGWMDQDATWYGGRPRPRPHCVRWGPSPSPKRMSKAISNFRPMSIVAKRLDGSRWHLARRYTSAQDTC